MSRHSRLISTAAKYSLHVSWHSSDGVRCYRFHRKAADYHSGGHIGHCNGIKQAEAFMCGFASASNTERNALLDAIAQVLTGKGVDRSIEDIMQAPMRGDTVVYGGRVFTYKPDLAEWWSGDECHTVVYRHSVIKEYTSLGLVTQE